MIDEFFYRLLSGVVLFPLDIAVSVVNFLVNGAAVAAAVAAATIAIRAAAASATAAAAEIFATITTTAAVGWGEDGGFMEGL
jgi:hypothetical protein